MKESEPIPIRSRIQLAPQGAALRTSWLELFFDLVFAAAISALGHFLGFHLTPWGLVAFLALSHPFYWVWTNHTVFSSRFAANDAVHHLLTFGIILAAVGMTVQLPNVLTSGSSPFVMAYLAARALLFALHLRPRWHLPEARHVHDVYFIGSGVAMTFWLASLAFPAPARYVLWGLGIATDLTFPWFDRANLKEVPVNTSHLPERLALFVLLVLGETILALVSGLSHVSWGVVNWTAAALAIALAGALYWAYFTFVELADQECTLGTGMPYIYSHMPLVAATAALGVGVGRFLLEAHLAHLAPPTLWILGLGVPTWLLAFLTIQFVAEQSRLTGPFIGLYVAAASLAALIAGVGGYLPPLVVMGAMVGLLTWLASFEIRFCRYELGLILHRDRRLRSIQRVRPHELAERLGRGEAIALLDVRRHPDDHQIPGSLRFEPDDLLQATNVVLPFDRDRFIVTYCT